MTMATRSVEHRRLNKGFHSKYSVGFIDIHLMKNRRHIDRNVEMTREKDENNSPNVYRVNIGNSSLQKFMCACVYVFVYLFAFIFASVSVRERGKITGLFLSMFIIISLILSVRLFTAYDSRKY